jgi:molybdopterin synthase sulfur carrier subunit
MRVLYFAWVRERVGRAEEEFALPPGVRDVAGLIEYLIARSPGHASAFSNRTAIRAAVNQDFAALDAPVADADEIAFFPPVTGG